MVALLLVSGITTMNAIGITAIWNFSRTGRRTERFAGRSCLSEDPSSYIIAVACVA